VIGPLAGVDELWVVDFEFIHPDGERPTEVHTLVALEIQTGRRIEVHGAAELQALEAAPYRCDQSAAVVAYAAQAEMLCHLALNWPMPRRVVDLHVEYLRHTNNGLKRDSGLLDALRGFGLSGVSVGEKTRLRQLAMRGGPYNASEARALVEYCGQDVDATAQLLERMRPVIDWPRAEVRGEFSKSGARIQWQGIPMDTELINRIDTHLDSIKYGLIEAVDEFDLYEGLTFKDQRFRSFLSDTRHKYSWPALPTGRLKMDRDTWKEQCVIYPELEPLRQLRKTMVQVRLADLPIGKDGRSRYYLGAFNSKTGRHYPKGKECIFAGPRWTRGLIKPTPDTALVYVDWASAEIGIAAALSGDLNLSEAYRSGDPYLAFAKQCGAAPPEANKQSHKAVRDRFKTTTLAVNYGMGVKSLAARLDGVEARAQQLLNLHRRTYPDYWAFAKRAVDHAFRFGYLETALGWRLGVSERTTDRSAANWPVQSTGAEILRMGCIGAHELGLNICATVHDAILFEAPLAGLRDSVAQMEAVMARASAAVLDGFALRAESKIVRSPDRYMDEDGQEMFNRVIRCLNKAEIDHRSPFSRTTERRQT